MVASDTRGNITRPPNRSVSAPTGIRPSDPTTTGTATSRACCEPDRSSRSLNRGAERAEQRPGPEVDREPDRRQREHERRPVALVEPAVTGAAAGAHPTVGTTWTAQAACSWQYDATEPSVPWASSPTTRTVARRLRSTRVRPGLPLTTSKVQRSRGLPAQGVERGLERRRVDLGARLGVEAGADDLHEADAAVARHGLLDGRAGHGQGGPVVGQAGDHLSGRAATGRQLLGRECAHGHNGVGATPRAQGRTSRRHPRTSPPAVAPPAGDVRH